MLASGEAMEENNSVSRFSFLFLFFQDNFFM